VDEGGERGKKKKKKEWGGLATVLCWREIDGELLTRGGKKEEERRKEVLQRQPVCGGQVKKKREGKRGGMKTKHSLTPQPYTYRNVQQKTKEREPSLHLFTLRKG